MAVSTTLSYQCVVNVRLAVIKFGTLFKHDNQLYQAYINVCLSNGAESSNVKKPPALFLCIGTSCYKTLSVVTDI